MPLVSGEYSRNYNWVQDKAAGIKITASRQDAELDSVASALSLAIFRDGQSTVSADIPFNGKKITNLGLATLPGDALSQAAGDARYIGAGGGGAGAIVVTVTATVAAFALGQNGLTNPAFQINDQATAQATGIQINGYAVGGGAQLGVISPGTDEALFIDSKGAGALNLNFSATGVVIVGHDMGVQGTFGVNGQALFNGGVLFTSAPVITAASLQMTGISPGIELGALAVANTPSIDFHSSGIASNDFDARIEGFGGNATVGQGGLEFFGSVFTFTARPQFAGNLAWDAGNLPASSYFAGISAAPTPAVLRVVEQQSDYQGAYSVGVTYFRGQWVFAAAGSGFYMSLTDNNVGNAVTPGLSNASWACMGAFSGAVGGGGARPA